MKKFVSIIVSASLLVVGLLPASASALSTASITMDAAYSSDGHFSAMVYEDTGTDTVTRANVVLAFNQQVANVSYDYSVGPFTAVTLSGVHNAYGTVTGRNPLARVSFTLAQPGTVIADVSTDTSYLTHADTESKTLQNFIFNAGEAYFTYTPPAPVQTTKKSTPAAHTSTNATTTTSAQTTANDTPAPVSTSDTSSSAASVKGDSTKSSSIAKKASSSHTGLIIASGAVVLVILAAGAYYWLVLRRKS